MLLLLDIFGCGSGSMISLQTSRPTTKPVRDAWHGIIQHCCALWVYLRKDHIVAILCLSHAGFLRPSAWTSLALYRGYCIPLADLSLFCSRNCDSASPQPCLLDRELGDCESRLLSSSLTFALHTACIALPRTNWRYF